MEQHHPPVAARDRLEALLERGDLERRLGVDLAEERLPEIRDLGARKAADEALRADDADLDPAQLEDRWSRSRTVTPASRRVAATSSARPEWWSWFPRTATTGNGAAARHASARTDASSGRPKVVRSPARRTSSARSAISAKES